MKRMLLSVAVVVLPVMAAAQHALVGTFAGSGDKPTVCLLRHGMYECKSCVPRYKIKADGTDQPVSGHPDYDTVAVRVVSDQKIEITNKKDGKVVATLTSTVSSDGKTLMFTFYDNSANDGWPVSGKGEAERVGKTGAELTLSPAHGELPRSTW